jgi:hypothetical protein
MGYAPPAQFRHDGGEWLTNPPPITWSEKSGLGILTFATEITSLIGTGKANQHGMVPISSLCCHDIAVIRLLRASSELKANSALNLFEEQKCRSYRCYDMEMTGITGHRKKMSGDLQTVEGDETKAFDC